MIKIIMEHLQFLITLESKEDHVTCYSYYSRDAQDYQPWEESMWQCQTALGWGVKKTTNPSYKSPL